VGKRATGKQAKVADPELFCTAPGQQRLIWEAKGTTLCLKRPLTTLSVSQNTSVQTANCRKSVSIQNQTGDIHITRLTCQPPDNQLYGR